MNTQVTQVFSQLMIFLHEQFGVPVQTIEWESVLIDNLGLLFHNSQN